MKNKLIPAESNQEELALIEAKKFHDLVIAETNDAKLALDHAISEYRKALESLVIREITGEERFKERFKKSLENTLDLYSTEPFYRILDEAEVDILVLDNLISMHEFYLLNPSEQEDYDD